MSRLVSIGKFAEFCKQHECWCGDCPLSVQGQPRSCMQAIVNSPAKVSDIIKESTARDLSNITCAQCAYRHIGLVETSGKIDTGHYCKAVRPIQVINEEDISVTCPMWCPKRYKKKGLYV